VTVGYDKSQKYNIQHNTQHRNSTNTIQKIINIIFSQGILVNEIVLNSDMNYAVSGSASNS